VALVALPLLRPVPPSLPSMLALLRRAELQVLVIVE
jgi:hypothetical protein